MCSCFHQPYRVRLVWLPGLSPPPTYCATFANCRSAAYPSGASDNTSSAKAIIFAVWETEDLIPAPDHKANWRRILHKPSGFLLPIETFLLHHQLPAIHASDPLRKRGGLPLCSLRECTGDVM